MDISVIGVNVGEVERERARLFPVPGIGGADEQNAVRPRRFWL
jgi:hypothetical protein